MTVIEIMAVGSILGLAAFTLNFAGFGNALVAVPLLALLMPIKAAVALQFPFALILLIYNAWRWRGRFEPRRLVVPIIAALIALPLGFLSLEYLPTGVMKKVLAGFIVLAVLALRLGLSRRLARGPVQKPWLGAVCGLLSGVFQGAYTTGGPPVVVYVRATTDDPAATKGFLGAYFTVIGLATAAMFGAGGLITGQTLLTCLYFSPAVVIGAVLGALAFRRLSSGGYRLVVDALLIAAAVLLWLRS